MRKRPVSSLTLGEIADDTVANNAGYTMYGGEDMIVVCAQGKYARAIKELCGSFQKEGALLIYIDLPKEKS